MGMGVSHTTLANNWTTTSNNNCKAYNSNPVPNETATWSGECKDGYVHGQGTLQWYINGKPNETYVGSFSQGKIHGKGIYTWAGGSKYDGEFKDNIRHGKGVQTWANGNKYDGEYKDGKFHGKGIYTWADGDKYDGKYEDGRRHGLGKFTFVKGSNAIASYYNGEWQGNTYVVQGQFYNDNFNRKMNNEQYANALKEQKAKDANALKEQKAKAEWTLTETYQCKVRNIHSNHTAKWSGGCQDGSVEGMGTLEWYKDDKLTGTYVGSFSQGNMQGKGVYTWANGDKYDGEYKDNKKHGKGIYTWASGTKYDGEWKDDKRHGKGIHTWANGSKYDGEQKDGKRHGLGKLTLVKGDNGIADYGNGEWQGDTYIVQGEFVDGDHTLQCEPNQKACDKARDKARAEQEKANIEACKSRYVGERLSLKAPHDVGFIFYSAEYKYLPFKVVGVGKDQMTVEAMYDRNTISDIRSANIPCNATSVR